MLFSSLPYKADVFFAAVLMQLVLAVYLDLKTAKFPNKFFISFLIFNVLLTILFRGGAGITVGLLTFGVAVLLLTPIYMVKILGGGDIKLMLAVSPVLLMDEFIGFLFMSFLWAGVFGLMRSLLGGNLRALLVNTLFMSKKITVATDKIPFTVGILLGWCSYKSFLGLGFL